MRTVPPTVTLKRILPLIRLAGITRLADVTGLDWLGIPVYQAVRPNSRNISVSMGKGLSRPQAKVSALMESLESFHAEVIRLPVRRATISSLREDLAYDPYELAIASPSAGRVLRDAEYDPYALPIASPGILHDSVPIDWVQGTDLSTGESTLVPKDLCQLDYCVEERLCPPFFRASSNGLASGNTASEALLHGLCEVIERDCMWRTQGERGDPQRWVDLSTIDSRPCQALIERLDRGGVKTYVLNATGPTGVPCFEAFLAQPESHSHYYGAGCHPNRAFAFIRALTEAAQSRVGYIAGSRDDLSRRKYLGPSRVTTAPLRGRPKGEFRDIPSLAFKGWTKTLDEIVSLVSRQTGMSPIAVDLSRPEFGLPVAFVLAPGLRLIPPRRR